MSPTHAIQSLLFFTHIAVGHTIINHATGLVIPFPLCSRRLVVMQVLLGVYGVCAESKISETRVSVSVYPRFRTFVPAAVSPVR